MKIERWNMYLQEFNIVIEYRSGKTNQADYMSGNHERQNMTVKETRRGKVVKQITANSLPTAI